MARQVVGVCSRPDCKREGRLTSLALRMYRRRTQVTYKYKLCSDCEIMLETILREACLPGMYSIQTVWDHVGV